MKRVLLTGANGFVGLNIAQALLQQGYEVRAWVRPSSNTQYLESMAVEIRRGEFPDQAALQDAMTGCEYVIHTAGNTSCRNSDLPALTAVNVDGTRAVVDAAVHAGVRRLVYTSTTSTIGSRRHRDRGADEQTRLRGFRARSPYALTKQQAENIVLAAQSQGLEVVILNLAEVIGGYDHNLQWGRMVLAVNFNQVPFVPPGGGSFCSASDAAMAHVNALTRGRSGSRYIISGADHRFAEFIEEIRRQLKRTDPLPQANCVLLWLQARGHELLPGIFRDPPLVESYRIRVFGGEHYFDAGKARRELAYQHSSLQVMVKECIDWYRQNGFLTGPV
ncbi:NAD-dependent epimerase/dehydratase family protein [Gynuella sunshinyii]|uniref:Nucleoside-diphosphate-sugar epimerase n=1 Tax=Gynuella sunshinyii YC6258 TaxID=1445510 RepID=A0A0C5VS76_9GAMM|nr:NAD-dependent epimerase/dehydratase family protein [Gynuella sunshinyii]AJQ97076.1 nucleoside-diphosphate-sugar epimerase [Gynuella sunshinyii YC6258]